MIDAAYDGVTTKHIQNTNRRHPATKKPEERGEKLE